MKIIVIFFFQIILFLPEQDGIAGFEDLGVGARALGLGGASVALADHADAVFINPAGLGRINAPDISLFWSQPFGLQELAYGVISMVCPIGRFHPGLAFQTFGCPAYRENTAVFSLGSTYQKKMFYGFNLRFHKLDIPGYGSDYCLGLDLGFLITLSPVTTWGFFARNVNRPTLGQDPEELPQIYCTGLSLTPLKTLILNLDMYKDIRYPTEVRAGLEYRLFEALALRTGVGNNPSRFTAGLGILVNIIEVDYAFSTHSDLGLTHQISLTICLNR